MTERATGTIAITVFLLFVVGIAVQGAFQTRASIADTFRREADMQRARVNLQEMLRLQTDEENFLRGYLLTRDPFYLEQYATAEAQWGGKESAVAAALQTERMTRALALLAQYVGLQTRWRQEIARPLLRAPGMNVVALDKKNNKLFTDYEARMADGLDAAIAGAGENLARSTQDQVNRSSYVRAFWVLVFGLLAILFNAYGSRLTRQLQEERMVTEVLQQAFRSASVPLPNCEIGASYLSASSRLRVGGDVYDVFRLEPGRALVTIADISGKGVDAAVLTAFARFAIRSIALRTADPGEILGEFNETFRRTIENPSLFITTLVGVLDCATGAFTYASAGHDSAYLRHGDRVEPLAVTGPLLGVMDATYTSRTISLQPGDTIVLATDGLTESRARSGELLGEQGAMEWIAAAPLEPGELVKALDERVRKRSGNRPMDDLALLALRYVGGTCDA